jgi:hypothetical protein
MWLPAVVAPIAQLVRFVFQGEPLNEARYCVIESCILGCIEAIEEHAPSDGDIMWYLTPRWYNGAVEFAWKNREIVRVEVYGSDRIFSLVNPFENIPD